MKRFVVVLAIVAISGLYALSRETEPAFACSGFGPIENMLESTVIFEGRVTSVAPNGPTGLDRSPHKLTFEVIRAHKGVAAGDTVVANALIPTGTVPVMCPQFPRDLAGKYVVIGLQPDREKPGELQASASVMPYLDDEPGGEWYPQAVRLAEMIADSTEASPRLSLEPAVLVCGQPVHLSGTRFPPGKYAVRYSFEARFIAVVDVGSNGAFELDTTVAMLGCRHSPSNGRPVAIHVLDVAAGVPWAWLNLLALKEIGFGPLAGAEDRPLPELRVTPNPARCSDTLEVRGTGFFPGERLNIGVGDGPFDNPVTADSNGSFVTRSAIPEGACDDGTLQIGAKQAGYEQYLRPFDVLASATVVREEGPSNPPGPPDLGTGPGATVDDGRSSAGVFGLALLVVASVVAIGAFLAKRAT